MSVQREPSFVPTGCAHVGKLKSFDSHAFDLKHSMEGSGDSCLSWKIKENNVVCDKKWSMVVSRLCIFHVNFVYHKYEETNDGAFECKLLIQESLMWTC